LEYEQHKINLVKLHGLTGVAFWCVGKKPDVKFKWHWIVFSGIPSFGYLAMPFQILTQNLSNKGVWTLLGLKPHSNISNLLDIIPGYRELDFYILSRIGSGRKTVPQSVNTKASAENQ